MFGKRGNDDTSRTVPEFRQPAPVALEAAPSRPSAPVAPQLGPTPSAAPARRMVDAPVIALAHQVLGTGPVLD